MAEAAAPSVDYYFAPHSPWTYLGHARFVEIAQRHGARVNVLPVDLGRVFPVSGGLPLAKRAPQRQAYRLVDLRRTAEHLGLPMNVQPRHFPVDPGDAAQLVIATDMAEGSDAALALAHALLRAVWEEQANIADPAVLQAALARCALPAALLEDAQSQTVHERYAADSEAAIAAGVFGAPSYVIAGEIFWGQDRLDFVERRLAALASMRR